MAANIGVQAERYCQRDCKQKSHLQLQMAFSKKNQDLFLRASALSHGAFDLQLVAATSFHALG
jgi:hypothetical protein